jgi:uncharacterized protein with von Willebrand factor type A (vWA) domain
MRAFLKDFSQSLLFQNLKAKATPEEATLMVLKLLQAANDAVKQRPSADKEPQGSAEEMSDILEVASDLADCMNSETDAAMLSALAKGAASKLDTGALKDKQRSQGTQAGKGSGPLQRIDHLLDAVIDAYKRVMANKGTSEMFNLARKFRYAAKRSRGEDYEFTDELTADVETRQMDHVSEIRHVLPTELALPDELFYLKLAKRELLVERHVQRITQSAVLHILLDVSMSMAGEAGIIANAITMAFLKSYMDSGDKFLMRFFDGGQHSLMQAFDDESMRYVTSRVATFGFSGSGTKIQNAVVCACEDIARFRDVGDKEFGEAEILLITDGEDSADASVLKEALELSGTKLNTILITGKVDRDRIASYEPLLEASTKFFDVDRNHFRERAESLIQQIKSEV